ncbi:MAG TPA: TonB family protein, partial [Thermoanaerobaculia bacterium]|nr:TonB family protein [Thermoanaerobaculia bacterium]
EPEPAQSVPARTEATPPPVQSSPGPPAQSPATETAAAQKPAETAPARPAPAPAKVSEGDLVQPGAPGLVEPELISLKKVEYPRLARMQRVQGIVILRVLVSETGQVTRAELLRGVPQNVGINEAATEMAQGARFKPATKDGVRVKAYKTITIPFKL